MAISPIRSSSGHHHIAAKPSAPISKPTVATGLMPRALTRRPPATAPTVIARVKLPSSRAVRVATSLASESSATARGALTIAVISATPTSAFATPADWKRRCRINDRGSIGCAERRSTITNATSKMSATPSSGQRHGASGFMSAPSRAAP